jgi:RimJ/RimL family protein N-acetyltransferase
MSIHVREMTLVETPMVMNYFRSSTPEHLEMLGVDPSRLPDPAMWAERFKQLYALPIERRWAFFVIWQANGQNVGFSSCDKIAFGEQAYMHLHITQPDQRQRGVGEACVRQSVELYFSRLELKRLFCEPNSFNVAPNRTLQKAGFVYVKTHMTVPGPLNYHQAVTRWSIER